jgi:hypothetical protein
LGPTEGGSEKWECRSFAAVGATQKEALPMTSISVFNSRFLLPKVPLDSPV